MASSRIEKILQAARRIPRGRVAAYKDLARAAGNPRLARLAGALIRKNRDKGVPCHRVVRADGRLGRYSLGEAREEVVSVEELPGAARHYVEFVERELDVEVCLVGTGAERERVLERADAFAAPI